jgi:hypothetical protein
MSDYLAVGGVTAVLKALLNTGLSDGGPATVLVSPPGITNKAPDLIQTGQDELPQLNLFMYYASINPALRNLDQPSVDSRGNPVGNPPLAINLHYLISAYGANPYDPEILLAFAMQVFHRTPVVPASVIQSALTALNSGGSPSNEQKLIAFSTMASQIEQIRITPEALTVEEIYRLWHAFGVSYRPTTSYQVSVVVIQDTQSFQSNPPVRSRSLIAMPLTGPLITSVSPQRVTAGQTLIITGQNFLNGPPSNTQVSFNEGPPITPATVQGDVVRVVVPGTLEAGVCDVRVMCSVEFPPATTPHPGFASSPVPFQLIPVIQPAALPPYTAARGAALTINVAPAVSAIQNAVVFIGDQAIPQPRVVPLPPAPSTANTVTVTVPNSIAVGAYPLRVQVDGAQSLLTQDSNPVSPTFGQWLPQVTVT